MKLPENYYHCFLGNGLDAVLLGYNGSMVPDKVGVDRCAWYKPEDRLVKVAGRFPMDRPLEHAQGSGWYEIAPLGHAWYDVVYQDQPLELQASVQHFEHYFFWRNWHRFSLSATHLLLLRHVIALKRHHVFTAYQ